MEKKVYFTLSLVLGVPLIRLVEVMATGKFPEGAQLTALGLHMALGLVLGTGCAMTAQLMNLKDKKVLWAIPLLAFAYSVLLILVTYPKHTFQLDPSVISTAILMDLGSWMIAVFGATYIGYVATRPRPNLVKARSTVSRI